MANFDEDRQLNISLVWVSKVHLRRVSIGIALLWELENKYQDQGVVRKTTTLSEWEASRRRGCGEGEVFTWP
jgi:hypothetical protein